MAYDYSELFAQAETWLAQAQKNAWLSQHITLAKPDNRALPDALYDRQGARPLLVAFMGGTGVGKSSLLNRLAGQTIAQAGIARPTSREVTLYHHQSVNVQGLPEPFPLAQVRIASHNDASKQQLIWIDTPDFDSVESANQQLVLSWLPYIDVLVYVVSPERYRDAKAWRLLLAEGGKHAWVFAFNQWDSGQDEQYVDFRQQLHQAGFDNPLIYKTICPSGGDGDEYAELQTTLIALANQNTLKQLAQLGLQARNRDLQQQLLNFQEALGNQSAWQQLALLWRQQWPKTSQLLQQGLAWPLQQTAQHYAGQAANLHNKANFEERLWDEWAQTRFDDALDELVIAADPLGIPTLPLKNQLGPLRPIAAQHIRQQTELELRQALAHPGNALQRGLLKLLHVMEVLLPLAAMTWAGYQVFTGYYTSSQSHSQYLGVDFAVHSSLLIALTWLIPFFILKKCQPSLQKSALRGLNKGVSKALSQLDGEVSNALDALAQQHQQHSQQLAQLVAHCADHQPPPTGASDPDNPLQRMLTHQR